MKVLHDVNMAEYTSFKVGGNASQLIIPETIDELAETIINLRNAQEPYAMLGNGTNTIFLDGGYKGTIIKLGESFDEVTVEGDIITAGAGALMSKVAAVALESELGGFEGLSGIPGSIGGAVFMNAGAYGYEIKDVIISVDVMKADGSGSVSLCPEDLELGYRTSVLQRSGDIVTSVKLRLTKANRADILSLSKEFLDKRVSKQPLKYPSAGSFFKRPEGHFAGKLIEDAGLKGMSVGGAQISELHAGFMINTGDATATDIIELMALVQNIVRDKFGIELEPEVRFLGEEK